MAQSWFPAPIRTTLQGLAGITSGRLGGLCANLLFGSLLLGVYALDWRTALSVFAAGGLAFAALFAILFRNSPGEHPLVNAAEARLIAGPTKPGATDIAGSPPPPSAAKPPRMSIAALLHSVQPRGLVTLIALNVQTILSTFADNLYSNWIPLFLWEAHGLSFGAMGVYSSLPLLGGALAGVAGGLLNDACIRLTGDRRWSRTGIAVCGKGLAAVLLVAALAWYDRPYVFCGLLFAVKFFGDWSLTTSWGVVTDIGGPATATVFAFNNAVAGLGLIAAPIVFGAIAQHFGWTPVFLTVAAAYLLCALSWLPIDCTRPLLETPGEQGG